MTRELSYPSETNRSPLGANVMSVGRLRAPLLSCCPAPPPTLPMNISKRPDGVNFIRRCPATSMVQILPSASRRIPCDDFTGTSVQDCSMCPDLSNCITGWAPRLNTHTLSFLSTSTPEVSPKFQPAGNFAQPSTA